MTEKRKLTYDLDAIKSTFGTTKSLNATGSAIRSAAALDLGIAEIIEIIQSIARRS